MNTCNSINSLALGKLLKKYNLTPKNKPNGEPQHGQVSTDSLEN